MPFLIRRNSTPSAQRNRINLFLSPLLVRPTTPKTDRRKFLRPEINQNNVLDVSNAPAERGGKEIYVLSFIIREVSAPSTAIINILPRRKAIAQATRLEKGSVEGVGYRWVGGKDEASSEPTRSLMKKYATDKLAYIFIWWCLLSLASAISWLLLKYLFLFQ